MAETVRRADYEYLQRFLRDRIGHELGEGKEYLVESRLGALAAELKLGGIAEVVDGLRRDDDPRLVESACAAMVTGETSFFRNASAFDRLKTTVIPTLLTARAGERRLRIWSAGCSTGQEPYSVAMMLLDHFVEARAWDVRILATDVAARPLRHAELGVYSKQEVARGLDPNWLRSYLHERGGRWSVVPEVRKLVRFERHNLLDGPPHDSSEFDVILARNVLIYFAEAARTRVLAGFRRAIRDDGYLFLGESETILGQDSGFLFAEAGTNYFRPAPWRSNFSAASP